MVIVKLYDRYIPVDKIKMVRFDARPEATEIVIKVDETEISTTLPVLDEKEKDMLVTLIMNSPKVVIDIKELVREIIESREVKS